VGHELQSLSFSLDEPEFAPAPAETVADGPKDERDGFREGLGFHEEANCCVLGEKSPIDLFPGDGLARGSMNLHTTPLSRVRDTARDVPSDLNVAGPSIRVIPVMNHPPFRRRCVGQSEKGSGGDAAVEPTGPVRPGRQQRGNGCRCLQPKKERRAKAVPAAPAKAQIRTALGRRPLTESDRPLPLICESPRAQVGGFAGSSSRCLCIMLRSRCSFNREIDLSSFSSRVQGKQTAQGAD
jgi:hypothetical protein